MKTGTLLASLLLPLILVAAAPAQAAVSFVNLTVKPGFNLISNPLDATDNLIGAVFKKFDGDVPGGTTVYKLVNGNFVAAAWDDLENRFVPESAAAETVLPGSGVYLFLPGTQERVITFVGEIPEGMIRLVIPPGFSIISNPIPMVVDPGSIIIFPPPSPIVLYKYNTTTRNFTASMFDQLDNQWVPGLPNLGVAEAVLVFNAGPAFNSCRTYTIMTPP